MISAQKLWWLGFFTFRCCASYHASLPSKQFCESLINSYCSLLCDTIWYNDLKRLLSQGEIANCDTTDFKNDLIERPLSWHWGRLRANSRLANIFSESTWKCDSFAVCRKIKGAQLRFEITLETLYFHFNYFVLHCPGMYLVSTCRSCPWLYDWCPTVTITLSQSA